MKILRATFIIASFLTITSVNAVSYAGTIVPGFNGSTLSNNDDDSTGPVPLGFDFNYFGTTYAQTYVNNNGNVTFNNSLPDYTPSGLNGPTKLPIIAPFFADIDTRESSPVTYGAGSYKGRNAFGVNYLDVGYYDFHANKTNSFQLILVERSDVSAGDADIYFNYDLILFETGDEDGGVNGLGGIAAYVGYSSGSGIEGTFFELTGSGVPGSFIDGGPFALDSASNVGVPGQFLFNVRSGLVTQPSTVPVPPLTGEVSEPGSLALLGVSMIGFVAARRRKTT